MIPEIKLKSGVKIPQIGLGTWQLAGQTCGNAVKSALKLGYRHIDTAEIYGNQREIGKAIKGFPRKELFITSKVWHGNLRYNDVLKAYENTISELQTDYLDLYLIHWPNRRIPISETFRALKKLYDEKKVRAVGISNFTIAHIEEALKHAEIPLVVNQVEFHPFLYQKELLDYCTKKGIKVTAYSPIARGAVFRNDTIIRIAEKYKKTAAQVSLRWLLEQDMVVIPKASTEQHLKENMDVFDFKLNDEDRKKLGNFDQKRFVDPISISEFDTSIIDKVNSTFNHILRSK
ncbi:TPA: aldo/keto reductase [Candidatus Woesearchaeota archaeon]|nr:Aldo/keto reductase [archaeon GW2011_AR15]MBS3104337.1 aldo/keto reductase [Candidatus Woesearchaeota archaeon]HIH40879.1 aldo/keto reductase [Candidatus Woesearchaeota archaeon]